MREDKQHSAHRRTTCESEEMSESIAQLTATCNTFWKLYCTCLVTGIDSGSRKLLESSRMAIPAASLPRQILAAVLRRPYRTLSIAQIAHQAEKP